ncbi:MAG: ABC transporter permease subunit [Planctomycetota bacterium]
MARRAIDGPLLGFLFRRHRLATGLCYVVPVLIGLVVGFLYPTYAPQREALKVFKYATRFLGQGQMDLFSAEGAFSLPFQHPLCLLALGLAAALAPLALPAGERGRGALDLLLASPLERGTLVRTLVLHEFLVALGVGAASLIGAWSGAMWAGESGTLTPERYLVLTALVASLALALGAIASWISVEARDRGQAALVYGVAMGVFFILDVAARMWRDGEWLGWLTPFGYLRPARILTTEDLASVAGRDLGVLLAVATVGFGLAIARQARRRSA